MLLFVSCFSAFPLSFQLPLMALLKATAEMLNKNFRRSSNPLCYFSKFILISYLAMTSVTFWILFQDSWCGLHFQIKVLEAQCSYLSKITAAPVCVLGGDARGCHSSQVWWVVLVSVLGCSVFPSRAWEQQVVNCVVGHVDTQEVTLLALSHQSPACQPPRPKHIEISQLIFSSVIRTADDVDLQKAVHNISKGVRLLIS